MRPPTRIRKVKTLMALFARPHDLKSRARTPTLRKVTVRLREGVHERQGKLGRLEDDSIFRKKGTRRWMAGVCRESEMELRGHAAFWPCDPRDRRTRRYQAQEN